MKKLMMLALLGLTVFVPGSIFAGGKAAGGDVDSGSFGVFVNARRVATETFSVHQNSDGVSTISSQIRQEDASTASQSSELQITSGGALVRYQWHELAPGKTELVVVPNNEFLLERVTDNPGDKPAEQPFLMPNTSVVLDNNSFVQREVLAWRYLASSCSTESGQMKCTAAQFGAIIPQERISTRVNIHPTGMEKVSIRGADQNLLHLKMKMDDADWNFWLDPQNHYKLMRLTKDGENTEIVRD